MNQSWFEPDLNIIAAFCTLRPPIKLLLLPEQDLITIQQFAFAMLLTAAHFELVDLNKQLYVPHILQLQGPLCV